MKAYDVYIMASRSRALFVGVSSDLEFRVRQHKLKLIPGFTAKYNVVRLVWHESFANVHDAIECERRLKGWRRSKKAALIEMSNPTWSDLAEGLSPMRTNPLGAAPTLSSRAKRGISGASPR